MFHDGIPGVLRRSTLEKTLANANQDAMFLSGLDSALIGFATVTSNLRVPAYCYDRLISVLQSRGMDRDEAATFYSQRISPVLQGNGTPVVVGAPVV